MIVADWQKQTYTTQWHTISVSRYWGVVFGYGGWSPTERRPKFKTYAGERRRNPQYYLPDLHGWSSAKGPFSIPWRFWPTQRSHSGFAVAFAFANDDFQDLYFGVCVQSVAVPYGPVNKVHTSICYFADDCSYSSWQICCYSELKDGLKK